MHSFGNGLQTFRPVVGGVHSTHNSEKSLCSTYIRCSLLTADMLLACLQRHTQGTVVLCINRYTNYAAGYYSFELVGSGKKRSMGSTKTHRHTKALRVPYHA